MEKPEVSVIIPVFNSGEFLEETLASLRAQTFQSFEVLIVDNGSDQKQTLDVLRKVETEFKVLKTDIPNVSMARNFGMEEAKGKYILPLDSDDKINPSFLEKCIRLMESDPDCKVVRTQAKLFGKKNGIMTFEDYSFGRLLATNLMVVTSLFKREEGLKVGGFDGKLDRAFEDWEFWINLLKDGGKVLTVDEPLFQYRIRKGSRNHSLRLEQLSEARRMIWEKHKAYFSQHFLDPRESFEYKLITQSYSYKLGELLTSPFRSLRLMP